MNDDEKIVVTFMASVVILILLSAITSYFLMGHSCKVAYRGLSPTYTLVSGCLVTPPGKNYKIPAANFRVMEN